MLREKIEGLMRGLFEFILSWRLGVKASSPREVRDRWRRVLGEKGLEHLSTELRAMSFLLSEEAPDEKVCLGEKE